MSLVVCCLQWMICLLFVCVSIKYCLSVVSSFVVRSFACVFARSHSCLVGCLFLCCIVCFVNVCVMSIVRSCVSSLVGMSSKSVYKNVVSNVMDRRLGATGIAYKQQRAETRNNITRRDPLRMAPGTADRQTMLRVRSTSVSSI